MSKWVYNCNLLIEFHSDVIRYLSIGSIWILFKAKVHNINGERENIPFDSIADRHFGHRSIERAPIHFVSK